MCVGRKRQRGISGGGKRDVGGPHEMKRGVDSETQRCDACVEEEVVHRRLNVKGARSFSQTDYRSSSYS